MGPPGSGKGTQAKRVAAAHHIPHVSTGDILREAIREGTAVGRKAEGFMSAGNLVPDDLMIRIIEERFGRGDTSRGYILDGFPRTVPQAVALDSLLGRLREPLHAVILLECSDAIVVERITGRRTCVRCGTPYHLVFQKPRKDRVCDVDGSLLVQREDDTEPKVRRRLEKYHSETAAIIPFYESKGIVRRVDATREPDEVQRQVEAALPKM